MGPKNFFCQNFFGDFPSRINAEGKIVPKFAIYVVGTRSPGAVQLDLKVICLDYRSHQIEPRLTLLPRKVEFGKSIS